MSGSVDIILLAAGASSRMKGGDKTLELVNGVPLLRHLAMECVKSRARKTVAVLPPNCPQREHVIRDLDVMPLIAENAKLGMSASIKAGINGVRGADAVLIVLADMPEIKAMHLDKIIAAYLADRSRQIVRAVGTDGTAGHPVLFDKSLIETLQILSGDQGAKNLLKTHKVHKVPLDASAATTDLDTPEDWAEWRAQQS